MPHTGELRRNARARAQAEQRRVLQIARRLSATLGTDFFHSLVRNLAEVLSVECVYLAELCGISSDRLRTLAVMRGAGVSPNFEQPLSGTAAGQALSDGAFAHSRGVQEIFPADPHLGDIGAEGFAALRLSDSAGQPLGVLAIVSLQPLPDIPLVNSVLGSFVPRAAAEIERKRNDDFHRENEERYHAFVASNPDAMWRLEFEPPIPVDQPEDELIEQLYRFGYLAECNDASARLFGREFAAHLEGLPFAVFVPRTDAALQNDLCSLIRSGFRATVQQKVVTDESGTQRYWLRTQFGIVENGRLLRLWGNTRDITQLRRAELSTVASERRFREVLEGIHLPAFMLDPAGSITFCNQTFVDLTARSKGDLGQLPWMLGIVSEAESETWKAAIKLEPSGEETLQFEGEILQPGGPPRLVLWDTICVRDQDNRAIALAAIGRDLTYERALEAQIRQAQKLDGIGRLAAGLAHDFNNLLTVVLGNASYLLGQVTESDRAYIRLLEIVESAAMCGRLTDKLLAFGRKQPVAPELLDLNDVIEGAEGVIRGMLGPGVALTLQLENPLSLVLADPTQIEQVLANLASNARDAMPDGGTLTITTENVEVGEEDSAYPGTEPGPYVHLSVADTGKGVSDEVLAHVFEPFFTTKPEGQGTGLGLSTVYGIVTQTGGHIAVRSERGKGTTFDILFPAPPQVIH